MTSRKQSNNNQIAIITLVVAGVASILVSAFISSSFLAILGTALVFWGVVLLFITPAKNVPITLLNASAVSNSDNLERVLSEFGLTAKGVYLPPENLKNAESSLIFVPKEDNVHLPMPDEISEKLTSQIKNGIYLTPQVSPSVHFSRKKSLHPSLK